MYFEIDSENYISKNVQYRVIETLAALEVLEGMIQSLGI
jgi:hypothetical protein